MSKEKVPMKIVVPIIVVTWILSLVTTLAIVYMAPTLFPVRREQISEGSITSDKIADEAVITAKLADGNVTSAKILDGTIIAVDLADGSVISVKVANGAVTTDKIANGNVTTDKIANDAIVTIKLHDDSVTSAKIVNGTIIAADLATNSVTSIQIADGEVKEMDIADGAVTNRKLAPMAIRFASTNITTTASISPSATLNDMDATSVSMTLDRKSHVIIMFSSTFQVDDAGTWINMRAMVGSTVAYPEETSLMFGTSDTAGYWGTRDYSYIFYLPDVTAGTYIVKMQWAYQGPGATGQAHVLSRTLNVIALPA